MPANTPPFLKQIIRIEWLLIALAVLSVTYFPMPEIENSLKPQQVFDYRLRMQFDNTEHEVALSTYLPQNSDRQKILNSNLQAPGLAQQRFSTPSGFIGSWQGDGQASTIDYQALIQAQAFEFELDANLPLNPAKIDYWPNTLAATEEIQVNHPEIESLWQAIQPQQTDALLPVISAIYDYTLALETLPFKGTTDALTALRLGAASCNGKSRLFVALARHVGIPARLVGGVILNEGKKRTSHQWLELNIDQQWVPFDPSNDYFATLPSHYLELYVGDKALFTRTADINFDYFFEVSYRTLSPALFLQDKNGAIGTRTPALTGLFHTLNIPMQAAAILLSLPLCALIVTALRNVFGVKSFGVFMPMLVASACTLIGIVPGLLGLTVVVIIGAACHVYFGKMNMLKIPRLAAVITVVSATTVALLLWVKQASTIQIGVVSLFPVVIISFLADKLSDLVEEQQWQDLTASLAGTLMIVLCCYACIQSASLMGLLLLFPEVFLVILAAQIYLGRWTGLRVSELLRFKPLLQKGINVLGINERNIQYVGALNNPKDLRTAVDKLATKKLLQQHNIPCPETIVCFEQFGDLDQLASYISTREQFVIKPNAGSQGKGIIVVRAKQGQCWQASGGKQFSLPLLANHIKEIINGNFAQHGQQDIAYIEPLIEQHSLLERLSGCGLCDIRVVIIRGKLVSAMLRIPTKHSAGKANLHQGALGAAVNLKTGEITRCLLHGKPLTHHPDHGERIVGLSIPHWHHVIKISQACSRAIGLGYLGVDICVDRIQGPLVLELNGRPGLEIQNVTQQSLNQSHHSIQGAIA